MTFLCSCKSDVLHKRVKGLTSADPPKEKKKIEEKKRIIPSPSLENVIVEIAVAKAMKQREREKGVKKKHANTFS